jgi:hypothetical protein
MEKNITKVWTDKANELLLGKQITEVRYLNQKEAENFMWDYRPVVFQLDDGTWIIPMCDDEGNNGGVLAVGPDKILPVLRGDD